MLVRNVAILLSLAVTALGIQTACPNWSPWGPLTKCQGTGLCPTVVAVFQKGVLQKGLRRLQQLLIKEIYEFKTKFPLETNAELSSGEKKTVQVIGAVGDHIGSYYGLPPKSISFLTDLATGSVKAKIKSLKIKDYKVPTIQIVTPSNSTIGAHIKDLKVKVSYRAKCEYKKFGKKIKKTLKIENKITVRGADIIYDIVTDDENRPKLKFKRCGEDIKVDQKIKEWAIDALADLLGAEGKLGIRSDQLGSFSDVAIDKLVINNSTCQCAGGMERKVKGWLRNKVCDSIKKAVEGLNIAETLATFVPVQQVRDGVNIAFPTPAMEIVEGNVYVHMMAFMKFGSVGNAANTAVRLQRIPLRHEQLRVCLDDTYSFHVAYSDYFFSSFLHQAQDSGQLDFSTDDGQGPSSALVRSLFRITCGRREHCIGHLMDNLRFKYKDTQLVAEIRPIRPLSLTVSHHHLLTNVHPTLNVNGMNATLVLKKNNIPVFTVGWLTFKSTMVLSPKMQGNRLKMNFSARKFNLEVERMQFTPLLPETDLVESAIEEALAPYMFDKLDNILDTLLPELEGAPIKGATLTAADYNMLQISGDF